MFTDYLRLAFRNLVKSAGFTTINIFGFSVGLASTLLILIWATHELNYENFFSQKDRIFGIHMKIRGTEGEGDNSIPYATALLMQEQFPEIEAVTRMENYSFFETIILEDPEQEAEGERKSFYEYSFNLADSCFFQIFDYYFLYGNRASAFSELYNIVLNRETAERFFGKSNPVGKELLMNGNQVYRVSGVVELPTNSELQFGSLVINRSVRSGDRLRGWDSNGPSFVMLREGVDQEALTAKVLHFLDELETPLVEEEDVMLVPLHKLHTTQGAGTMVFILLSVGVLILVIASLNYASLSSALLAARRKTISLFKLAGAKSRSVLVLTLFESNMVVLVSLLLSLLLVWLALPWFEGLTDLRLSVWALDLLKRGFPLLLLLLLLTGTLSGLLPGARFALVETNELLHTPVNTGRRRNWPRLLMVVFQFLISITLITNTAMMFQQRKYISSLPMGFQAENIIQVPINNALIGRFSDFSMALESIPGVEASTAASTMPATIGNNSTVIWGPGPEERGSSKFAMVSPGYFKTFGMELAEGLPFDEERPASLRTYIVNQSAVQRMGLENPIGHPITFWGKEGEIGGVVRDFQNNWLYRPLMPLVLSTQEDHLFFMKYLYVRLEDGNHAAIIRKIKKVTSEFAPEIPFDYSYVTDEIYNINRPGIRFNQIFLAFSIVSIFIAILGLLGMSLYSTVRRTKEIGIRKSHGAGTRDIVRILLGELYTGVGIAMVLAIPLVWFMSQSWLRYFVNRTDISWWIFALGGLIAALCALFSVGLQTVRAALQNPVKALRYE